VNLGNTGPAALFGCFRGNFFPAPLPVSNGSFFQPRHHAKRMEGKNFANSQLSGLLDQPLQFGGFEKPDSENDPDGGLGVSEMEFGIKAKETSRAVTRLMVA